MKLSKLLKIAHLFPVLNFKILLSFYYVNYILSLLYQCSAYGYLNYSITFEISRVGFIIDKKLKLNFSSNTYNDVKIQSNCI